MRNLLLVAGLIVTLVAPPALAQDEPIDEQMSARERVSYAVGYELGQRLQASGQQISPSQVAAGIREGNKGGETPLVDPTPGFRLGQMIVARGLNLSPSVLAEAMKDAMDGNVALLDADSRSAAIAEATGGPYAKVEAKVHEKVEGRANEAEAARVNSRAGYGAWSTPGVAPVQGPGAGGVSQGAQQRSDIRVAPSGRLEAGVNTQRVNAAVAGTSVNNAEVDAYQPVPPGQAQGR